MEKDGWTVALEVFTDSSISQKSLHRESACMTEGTYKDQGKQVVIEPNKNPLCMGPVPTM